MAVRAVAAQALAAMAPLDDDCLVDQLLSQLPSAGSPISSQNLVRGASFVPGCLAESSL